MLLFADFQDLTTECHYWQEEQQILLTGAILCQKYNCTTSFMHSVSQPNDTKCLSSPFITIYDAYQHVFAITLFKHFLFLFRVGRVLHFFLLLTYLSFAHWVEHLVSGEMYLLIFKNLLIFNTFSFPFWNEKCFCFSFSKWLFSFNSSNLENFCCCLFRIFTIDSKSLKIILILCLKIKKNFEL